MGRPTMNDDFSLYFNWLVQSEGKSPSTAKQYASTLRGVVREHPEILVRQTDFVRFFEDLRRAAPMKHVVVRSAWSSFARFQHQQNKISIPTFGVKVETYEPVEVPKDVIEAARVLHYHRVGIRLLVTLTWGDVDVRYLENPIALPIGITIKPPKLKHSIEAPIAPMRVLWNYARGERPRPFANMPLIPFVPGSLAPISMALLQEQINEFEVMTDAEYLAYIRNICPPSNEVTAANYKMPDVKQFRARPDQLPEIVDPNDVDDEETMLEAREVERKASLASIMAFDPNAD